MLNSIEICAGFGGQALGLEMAGFHHVALVEYEKDYCDLLVKIDLTGTSCVRMSKIFLVFFFVGRLIYLPAAFHAPPFPLQGSSLEVLMKEIFFLRQSD